MVFKLHSRGKLETTHIKTFSQGISPWIFEYWHPPGSEYPYLPLVVAEGSVICLLTWRGELANLLRVKNYSQILCDLNKGDLGGHEEHFILYIIHFCAKAENIVCCVMLFIAFWQSSFREHSFFSSWDAECVIHAHKVCRCAVFKLQTAWVH